MGDSIRFYMSIMIFTIGVIFNCVLLWFWCRREKWNQLDNTKYFIFSQRFFSLLVIWSSVIVMLGSYFTYEHCIFLPTLLTISFSLAIFNLTTLVVVKHAQIVSGYQWRLRSRPTFLIIITVIVVSLALQFPVLLYAVQGVPLITHNRPACVKVAIDNDFLISIDMFYYAYFHMLLQYFVPGIIFSNRCVLMMLYSWKTQNSDHNPGKQTKQFERWINILSVIVMALGTVLMYNIITQIDEQTIETANFIFYILRSCWLVATCIPTYQWEMCRVYHFKNVHI